MRDDLKTVALTGERLTELETVKDILREWGVAEQHITNQRALSAAMQVLIANHHNGGELVFHFVDGRSPEV